MLKEECDNLNCKKLREYSKDFRNVDGERITFVHTLGFQPMTDAYYLEKVFCSLKCFNEWFLTYHTKE
jgi:hypothetical protein